MQIRLLHDKTNISQSNVLDLGLSRKQRHERRRQLSLKTGAGFFILHKRKVINDKLNGRHNNCRIGMLKTRRHAFDDVFGFVGGRDISKRERCRLEQCKDAAKDEHYGLGKRIQDEYLAPFRAFV